MNKIFKYLKENEERAIYILLFFSIFIFSTIRLTLVDASLERDEGEYAYIAWLWMTGSGLPYVDAYSMKLPGIYIAYMAIFKFIGDGHQHIHMALILVNAVNTFFIFLISKKITNNYWGLVGAIFYLFLSFSLRFQGIFSQIEHFILLFALPAFYLSLKNNLKQKDFFIIGLLLGISFLMKQHAMFFALHTGIYLLIKIVFLDCDKNHKQTLIKFANLSAGFLLPFVITLLYFYTKSALHDMLFWTTEVARNYTNTTNFIDGISLFFKHRLYLFDDKILISALAAASLFIAIRKTFTKDSKSIFVVLFIMFSWITVSIGYYYRPHYLQLLAPVLAIGAVYFLFNIKILLEEKINKRFSRLIVHSIVIITLFSTFTVQLPYLYAYTGREATKATYVLTLFNESLDIARFIKSNSTEDDTIGILASEPQIAYYAGRKTTSPHIYTYNLLDDNIYAKQMLDEYYRDLINNNPKFIITTNVKTSGPPDLLAPEDIKKKIIKFISTNYRRTHIIVGNYEGTPLYNMDYVIMHPELLEQRHFSLYKRISHNED